MASKKVNPGSPASDRGARISHAARDESEHSGSNSTRQVGHRLTLTLLGGGAVHVRTDGFSSEPKFAVLPVAALQALVRAFVLAEAHHE